MRLLLIQSSHLNPDGTVFKSRHLPYPGLALPLIAALTPGDVDIRIVNDYFEKIDYDDPAEVVGLTAMAPQAPRCYQIADEFRRRGKKVVIGGFHASLFPEENIGHCDAVVVGEAEEVWPRVWEDLLSGKMQGIYRAASHPRLAGLPAPRYDLLNRRGYSLLALPVQTTRGCPHHCEFCSVHHFFGGSYRHRPIGEVVRDIKAAASPYISFIDDNIAADKTYTMELLQAIRPLGIVWGGQCNVSACEDEEFLRSAADSGCLSLMLGLESVEQASLDLAGKDFNRTDSYSRILDKIRAAGIAAQVCMILGMDGDSPETFDRTYDFLMSNKVPVAYFFILTPAPGTPFFERAEREGRLLHKDWSRYGGDECVYVPKHLTKEQLEDGFWDLFRRLYSTGAIVRRVLWPPRWSFRTFIMLKYNQLHRRSLRRGIHPLRG